MPHSKPRPWPGRPASWDWHLNHLASRASRKEPVFTAAETALAIRERRGAWAALRT
jgi:hypothetical protein